MIIIITTIIHRYMKHVVDKMISEYARLNFCNKAFNERNQHNEELINVRLESAWEWEEGFFVSVCEIHT